MKRKPFLKELGITAEQVLALPKVSPDLKILMADKKQKGLPSDIYYYMEACPDLSVRRILAKRDSMLNKAIPLEAYCAALDVDPLQVLNAIVAASDRLETYVSSGRLTNSKREVADVLVAEALRQDEIGTANRMLFMKATGMLPQPKGAQTLIQVTQNASQAGQAVVLPPSPENMIRRLSDRMNQFQLPAPAEDAEIEVEE